MYMRRHRFNRWQGSEGPCLLSWAIWAVQRVLVQWELMSALTVRGPLHRLSCVQRRQLQQPGSEGPCLLSWAIWANTACVLVQWELMAALTLMACLGRMAMLPRVAHTGPLDYQGLWVRGRIPP
jgi:hypothetical protein